MDNGLLPGTRIQATTDFFGKDVEEIDYRYGVRTDEKGIVLREDSLDGLLMPIIGEPQIVPRISTCKSLYIKGRKDGQLYGLTGFGGIRYEDYSTPSEYLLAHVYAGLCNQSSGQGENIARQYGGTHKIKIDADETITTGTWMYAVPNIQYIDPKSGKMTDYDFIALKTDKWIYDHVDGTKVYPVGRCNFKIISQRKLDQIINALEAKDSKNEMEFLKISLSLDNHINVNHTLRKELENENETRNGRILLEKWFENDKNLPYENTHEWLKNKYYSDMENMKLAEKHVRSTSKYRSNFKAYRVGKAFIGSYEEVNRVNGGNESVVPALQIIVSLPGVE